LLTRLGATDDFRPNRIRPEDHKRSGRRTRHLSCGEATRHLKRHDQRRNRRPHRVRQDNPPFNRTINGISHNVQRFPARRHRLPAGPQAEPRTAAKARSRAPCTPERAQRAEADTAVLYAGAARSLTGHLSGAVPTNNARSRRYVCRTKAVLRQEHMNEPEFLS
jgi:hypothetical protein